MWVSQCGGDIELEIFRIFNHVLAQFHILTIELKRNLVLIDSSTLKGQ